MAGKSEYPLSLIIRAVDKATAPLRQINKRIAESTRPLRTLNNSFRALAQEAGLTSLARRFGDVGKAAAGVGRQVAGVGTALAGAFVGGFGLYTLVRNAVDAGDALGTMAQRVGLNVDAYAQLQFAAAQADVEQEQFNSAMDQFNKRLGEARSGGGPMLAFLNKVSPALAAQVRGAGSTEEALELMMSAFEKVEDPARRAAMSAAMFGKSGLQMGQWLGQGRAAIDEQRKAFADLAGSQAEYVRRSGELDNAMRSVGTAFQGLVAGSLSELFPALTEVANAITRLLVGSGGGLREWARETGAALTEWVQGGNLDRLVETMREWGERIGWVVEKLGGLKGVLTIVAAYMGLSAVASVYALGASLVGAGKDVLLFAARLKGILLPALGKMFTALMTMNFAPLLSGFSTAAKAVWGFNAALWANPIVLIIGAIALLAGAAFLIYKYWDPIKKFFIDLWDSIVSAFNWAWEKIKPIVDNVMKVLEYSPLGLAFKAGKAVAGSIFGGDETQPELGAAAAAPAGAPGEAGSAHVTVDFANLPRGARVTPEPGATADLDLSLGYSMTGT